MATFTPVDGDPFASAPEPAAAAPTSTGPIFTPVDNDPFAGAPQPTQPGYWNAALEAGNAALLGAGTRLMAATQAVKQGLNEGRLWDSDMYDQALDHYRGARSNYETQNPKTAFAANAIGSIPPAMMTAGSIAPLVGEGLGGASLTNAGTGGILDAAGGAIDTDGSASYKFRAAAAQGALGAGLGAVSVPVGAVVGKAAGAVGQKLADAAFTRFNGAGLTPDAADALTKAFAMQGQSPSDALTAAQNLGTGATFADTGQATRDLTARLAAREPNAAPIISQNLTARADNFAPRINQAVSDLAGPDFNAVDALSALKARTAANGAANYGPVLNSRATVDVTPVRDAIAQIRVDPIAEGVAEDPISRRSAGRNGFSSARTPAPFLSSSRTMRKWRSATKPTPPCAQATSRRRGR